MVYLIEPGKPMFPEGLEPDEDGLAAVGGELTTESLLEAYGKGLFPWTGRQPIPWCSPDPRLVLFPDQLRVSRSLRRAIRQQRFEIRFDAAFEAVMLGCAAVPRDGQHGTWITSNMLTAYTALHRLGHAHSVEAYREGRLVGGLYGVSLGRAFFGESMFSLASDASKVALHALCRRLIAWRFHLIDCQQVTAHLMSLGAVPLLRSDYLRRLEAALALPGRRGAWSTED